MRILMVHNRYVQPGGEDVSTQLLVDALRAAGHTVGSLEDTNERIADLGRVRTAVRATWSVEGYKRAGRVLARGWDVMHVQNFFPLFSPSVYYAARSAGVPVVQSLRNFRLLCPQPMMIRDGQICEDCVGRRFAWPAIKYACYRDSRLGSGAIGVMSAAHRAVNTWERLVHRYIAPSEFARSKFLDAGWLNGKVSVVPNFVHPDPGPKPSDGGHALYVGRLSAAKGVGVLLDAWLHGSIGLPLWIVGDGELRQAVEQAVRHSNDDIRYLGPRPWTEVMQLVGSAQFVVVPSLVYETFGRVVVEAQATATPAIASRIGALEEVVDHEETGLLVPRGDVDALIAAAASLAHDAKKQRRFGDNARHAFVENHTAARNVALTTQVYRDAMSAAARQG